jgi:hypothetical protein
MENKEENLSEFDIEEMIKNVKEKVPKSVFEKCMIDVICEKNKILENKMVSEKDKKLIEEYDKVVLRIQEYLSVATK